MGVTVEEVVGAAKMYEMTTPQFGVVKKLVSTVNCDGVQMSISSDGCAGSEFIEADHREKLRVKVSAFLENRKTCNISM